MTLQLNRLKEIIKVHVRGKLHRAKCIGSWVRPTSCLRCYRVDREKKTQLKTELSSLLRRVITWDFRRPAQHDCCPGTGVWWKLMDSFGHGIKALSRHWARRAPSAFTTDEQRSASTRKHAAVVNRVQSHRTKTLPSIGRRQVREPACPCKALTSSSSSH